MILCFVFFSFFHLSVSRARAKSGVKILGATATTDQWNVSFESENTKQTLARVTIVRNEQESESTLSPTSLDENEYVVGTIVVIDRKNLSIRILIKMCISFV